MIYFLDTSVIIEYFRKNPSAGKFFDAYENDIFITSSICEAELGEGIYREKPEKLNEKLTQKNTFFDELGEVVDFDRQQADIAGKIRAGLSLRGSKIGDIDVLIAAAAISKEATLVTQNTKHFQRIEGLQVISI